MPLTVSISEARLHFSQLLEQVRRGERVIITRQGVPIAELSAPAMQGSPNLSEILSELREIRRRTRSGKESVQSLIREGRRF
jgi:antitoxin (DNA-binding transcriptional repressor) of toxin-antitoxin stability system